MLCQSKRYVECKGNKIGSLTESIIEPVW